LLREIRDQTFAEFWRELAKLITLFDEHSPSIFSERESANSLGNGAPGRSRTCDPRLRRPSVLWPLANRGPDHWSGGPEVKVTSQPGLWFRRSSVQQPRSGPRSVMPWPLWSWCRDLPLWRQFAPDFPTPRARLEPKAITGRTTPLATRARLRAGRDAGPSCGSERKSDRAVTSGWRPGLSNATVTPI